MKLILLVVVVAVAAFYGYPMVNEDTTSECDALERIAVRVIPGAPGQPAQSLDAMAGQFLGQLLQGASKGQLMQVAVRNQFPNLPVGAACALLYWKALVDPEAYRKEPLGQWP